MKRERHRKVRAIRRFTLGLGMAAALTLATFSLWAKVIDIPTTDPPRKVRIVTTGSPGGITVDKAGNIYYSDQNAGRVYMLRGGHEPAIAILEGLDRPQGTKISKDGRALIIGYYDGRVERHYFGLTAQIKDANGTLVNNAKVYVESSRGPTPAVGSDPDGFYRIPDLLVPQQTTSTLHLTLERPGAPTSYVTVNLGQPGFADLFGQTIKLMQLK